MAETEYVANDFQMLVANFCKLAPVGYSQLFPVEYANNNTTFYGDSGATQNNGYFCAQIPA